MRILKFLQPHTSYCWETHWCHSCCMVFKLLVENTTTNRTCGYMHTQANQSISDLRWNWTNSNLFFSILIFPHQLFTFFFCICHVSDMECEQYHSPQLRQTNKTGTTSPKILKYLCSLSFVDLFTVSTEAWWQSVSFSRLRPRRQKRASIDASSRVKFSALCLCHHCCCLPGLTLSTTDAK